MQVPAGSLLGAALTYARAGWPVFPCRGDKSPATTHGFHDASCADELVSRWWSALPGALIGMPVKPGFIVVDVDDLDAFEELDRLGMQLPATLTAATPRGQHLWYTTRRRIGPKAGIIPHVDLRGPGSYVIVPPSPGYRWLQIGAIRGLG